MTLTHHGGVDIEELDRNLVSQIPFDPLTGLKAFVVANALSALNAPKEIISPLVQHLPKLWELYHNFGMTTLELNPIRMRVQSDGRLVPVACDFKGGFDRDDTRWQRLNLPPHLFSMDHSDFEHEINQLRTYQGQSDVYVINERGTILAPTFGGGANSLVSELLGEDAIISSDFGGNPPYQKMKEVARICFRHWLDQANVLFIIGGKSNNTDIFETFRAMADALREHFSEQGSTPLYVVIGRGGPNLVGGMGVMRDTCEALGLPYSMFGFDSDISEVIQYAKACDAWMKSGGREQLACKLTTARQPAASAT
jgi:succinyl-CoA synthetase beta subunit